MREFTLMSREMGERLRVGEEWGKLFIFFRGGKNVTIFAKE